MEDATFFIRNAKEDETFLQKAKVAINTAQELILEDSRTSMHQFSPEILVMFIEVALLSGTRDEVADQICKYYFQRILQKDQFYCRALLAKSSIEANRVKSQNLKGEENLKQVKDAFNYVKQAIEIASKAENKAKYQFVVYNSSIKTYNILRNLMKQDWMKFLTEILEQVSNLLEESDDFDSNWRCRYLNSLMRALFDGEKKPEALKVLDKLVDLTKKKGQCDFHEQLFRNRIHYYRDNNGMLGNIKKETETGPDPNSFKHLFIVQQIKSGAIPEAQVEKELQQVMMAIAPQSISNDSTTQNAKISQIDLDRLSECSRMCIKHGLIKFAEGAVQVINRGSPTLRAQIWTLYTQAEILLKKQSTDIDVKTNMKLNTLQKQMEDLERRKDALSLMERAMIANKKLLDADVINEGCYLIWNMSLPFLKGSTRNLLYRPFTAAAQALENISSNENQLRIQLHLELAKHEINQDLLSNALAQLKKCLSIDCSLTLKNIGIEDKNKDDMERPFDKYIKFLIKGLDLKTNLYGGGPQTIHDQIILDLENAKSSRDSKMRETILNKALREISDYEVKEYRYDPKLDLVQEEIDLAKFNHDKQNTVEAKQRVLILNEMSKLAYEDMLIDISFQAASLAVKDEWDAQLDRDLIIAQSESHLILSKCYVEYLLEDNVEIGYKELVFLDQSNEEDMDISKEDKAKYTSYKQKFADHIIKSIKFASQSNQPWQIFNGSIEFWNNYLPVFKTLAFTDIILEEGISAMQEAFEGMNNCFQTANFSAENVDYELSKKMNIFSNLSVMLARVNEFLEKKDETVRICDLLLQKQLPSHLRKTFDSIKARVTKAVSSGGAAAAKGGAKGAKDAPVQEQSKSEQVQAEIVGYIELIKNGQKEQIQKAIECLSAWKPDDQEEIELELNAELWCKVGRLAIGQDQNQYTKMALYCAESCILQADKKAQNKNYSDIPITRLRWYSVSECLYGESLAKLIDAKKQEKESQDALLLQSVLHYVESAQIASIAKIGFLVLENCKCMWNSLIGLLDSPNNFTKLVVPLSKTHDYLRDVKEDSDPDFLSLFYSALFMCINDQKDWKLGEKIVDQAFTYVPNSHHKVLWEAKMNYLSKLGKNVLQAISNMKESNASLMAKVYVKLARSSSQRLEQHSAYNKAIEILRKEESIEVVEVLIEYAEWLHRSNYATTDVEDNLLLAADVLMDIEPGWDDEEDMDDDGDDYERKTKRSKSSKISKGSKAKTKVSRAPRSTMKSKAPKSRVSNASKRKSIRSKTSAKTNKTKSSLKVRQEEDAHPQFLNVQHYEKLVRIYSMLTMVAHDSTKQQEYVLDAHFFIMKMFEQSFQVLNAIIFFEQHQNVLQMQGYSAENIKEYLQELMTSGDFAIPLKHSLPEKLDQWISFNMPEQLFEKSRIHEDNMMIAKVTFSKPELTLFHLRNVNTILETYLFSMQQVPVLHLIELFSNEIIQDKILGQVAMMQRKRLLSNLGIQNEEKEDDEKDNYKLTQEERKFHFEKIKGLKDKNEEIREDSNQPLAPQDNKIPKVIEVSKIHNSWLQLSQELLKWGKFSEAKELIQEVMIHSRILKDQHSFANAMLSFSTIKYVEGEVGTALKLCIRTQQQCQDIVMMEQIVCNTYYILAKFNKGDDAVKLLEESLMFVDQIIQKGAFNKNQSSTFTDLKQKSQASAQGQGEQNNLSLQFFKMKCLILLSQELINQASNDDISMKEQKRLEQGSFDRIDEFMKLQSVFGCHQSHLQDLLKYCEFLKQNADVDFQNFASDKIESAKTKYEKCAQLLLKNQDIVNDQLYYIGVNNEKQNTELISLPLQRQLGVTKLRIAQIYTQIGIIKNSIKQASQELMMASNEPTLSASNSQAGKSTGVDKEMQRLNREHATFMDQISKQIEANANAYSKEMNRYEKSIIILETALNLLHSDCVQFQECLIEIAKCKRLLAVNKKHIRGQWRQDAQDIDKINLQRDHSQTHADRREQLMEKNLDGEILDRYLDYKTEAIKAFVSISQLDEEEAAKEEAPVDPKAKKGEVIEEKKEPPKQSQSMNQILNTIGESRIENLLASYSIEFAECRGNLNKEQAFISLSQYQFAISRQMVLKNYFKNQNSKHPDIQRFKQETISKSNYSYFSSPRYPDGIVKNTADLNESSTMFQKLKSCVPGEILFENLEENQCYLMMQFSDDQQYMYINLLATLREGNNQFYLTKYHLASKYKDVLLNSQYKIEQILKTLERIKTQENEEAENIRKDCQKQIKQIIDKLESMFEQILMSFDTIINPEIDMTQEGTQDKPSQEKKDDKKKPDPKAKDKGKQPETQAIQNTLNMPLPTSGIQRLVLMVDRQIELIPFEFLKVFDKIPQVTRDLNLYFQMHNLNNSACHDALKEQQIDQATIVEQIKTYKKFYDSQWVVHK